MSEEPHVPGWRAALDKARQAPRCGARARTGFACEAPAMPNGRCRFHGGKSTGPVTVDGLARSKRSTWKHGYRSAGFLALKREIAANGRRLREAMRRGEQMLKNVGRLRAGRG